LNSRSRNSKRDRGAEILGRGLERQYHGRDQTPAIEEPGTDQQHFANLTPWQITQLARHPQRPYTLDYVSMIFTDWHELHGDRMYSDDLAIVGGFGTARGTPVMLIGHQKGRDTKERVRRNYGMPKPRAIARRCA